MRLSLLLKILKTVTVAAACLVLFACGAQKQPTVYKSKTKPAIKAKQKITFRVLDKRDRPIKKARIRITPLNGQVGVKKTVTTKGDGLAVLKYAPKTIDRTLGTNVKDIDYLFETKFRYEVSAKGYTSVTGKIQYEDTYRKAVSPELLMLNKDVKLPPIVETLTLYPQKDLFGKGLNSNSSPKLKKACLNYFKSMQKVVPFLGISFANPAFSYLRGELQIRFNFKGITWGGLYRAPFFAQAIVNSSLPMAISLGEDLLPAIKVKRIKLVICGNISSQDDPHAMPKRTLVIINAPKKAYEALANGSITPDNFLAQNLPMIKEKR